MELNRTKVVDFIRDHKKAIAIGAATLAGGITLIAFGKQTRIATIAGATISKLSTDVKVDGWDVGTLDMCWAESGHINAIVEGLTVKDAGKIGENLLKIKGVTPDTDLSIVIGIPDNRVS